MIGREEWLAPAFDWRQEWRGRATLPDLSLRRVVVALQIGFDAISEVEVRREDLEQTRARLRLRERQLRRLSAQELT